jgi:hypothetical protein
MPGDELPPTIEQSAAPTNGLVGEWKLDETSGTTAHDTKNGFDATVLGGAAFVAGKIGNGLNLNNGTAGTGGKYAEMPSNATLDNVQEGNYTISAWFYPYSVPPNTNVDDKSWAIVVKNGIHMGLVFESSGKFAARHFLTGNDLVYASSVGTYALNRWHHVAGVVNKAAGTLTLYVDGSNVGSDTFTPNTVAREYNSVLFRIGRAGPGTTMWTADGKVDQVRIYDRALSAAEVGDLFNESSGSSPSAALHAGLWWGAISTTDLGTGPGGNVGAPRYNMFQGVADVDPGDNNIDSLIAKANQHDIILVLRLSGGPAAYTTKSGDCFNYDAAKYRAQLDRFTSSDALREALASRRAVVLLVDEPWIDLYCEPSSITPNDVNEMGNAVKTRWPGAITTVRAPASFMIEGWDGFPAVPWTKIDYGWSQYNHVSAVNENQSPADFFAGQKDSLDTMADLGMIPGINIWNGGDKECWDAKNNGTSHGRIYGSQAEPASIRGTFESCASNPNPPNSTNWVASPTLLQSAIDAAVADPDAPFFAGWTHVVPGTTASWGVMEPLETRGDFVAAFDYWITEGATRTSWNDWRPAK